MMLKLPFIIAFILSITLSFVVNSTELLGDNVKKNITPAISKSVDKKTNKKIEPNFKTPALLGGRTKSDLKAPASLRNKAKSSFKSPSSLGAGVKSGFKTPAQFGNKASSSDGRSDFDNKAQKGFGRQGSTIGGAAVGGWQSNQPTNNGSPVSRSFIPGLIGSDTNASAATPERPSTGNPARPESAGSPNSSPRGATPSTSAAGKETFVLSNGRHVPRSVNGNPGQPNENGGVTYSDGRRVDPGPKGTTVFYNADGSVQSRIGAAQAASPSQSTTGQDTFRLSNGQQVPATNGKDAGTADSSGGVTYASGRRVYVDPDTGETVATNPDGSEQSRHAAPPTIGAVKASESESGEPSYELPNGQQVPRFLVKGDSGKPDGEGGVTYESGRRVYVDPDTGETVGVEANGEERSRDAAPPSVGTTGTGSTTESLDSNGTPSYQLGNGEHVPQTNEDGSPALLNADGSVTYTRVGEGGQIETVTFGATEDGMTVIEREGEMTFSFGPKERAQNGSGNIERIESSSNNYGGNGDMRGGTRINHGVGGAPDTASMGGGAIFELSPGDVVNANGSVTHGATGDTYSMNPAGQIVINRADGSTDVKPGPNGATSTSNNDAGSGDDNSGDDNSGDDNSGDDNSGDDNSGDDNSGDDNSGDDNSGDDNSGDDADTGGDTDTGGEEGTTEYREGGSNYNRAPGAKVINDFVGKKTGEKRDVESGTPAPCGEDDGSGRVAQPGPEGGTPCTPSIGNSDEEESETPSAEEQLTNRERSRQNGTVGQESVVNPGRFEDQMPDSNHALDTLDAIEQSVNPGTPR
jgi:hypothetical protein